jgi:hypothetical protein
MRIGLLVIIAALAMSELCSTQTIGPGGGLIAPGASQPQGPTPGGIGPGGVVIAPGSAGGVNFERLGPGGTRLAPGPAGTVDTPTGPQLQGLDNAR